MHALLHTLLLLAAQATPDHAALHPGHADVYLELPGWTELASSLSATPVAGLLRNEDFVEHLAGRVGEEHLDGLRTARGLLEGLGLEAELAAAIDRCLQQSERMSVSVCGLSLRPELVDDLHRLAVSLDRLEQLEAALWLQALDSGGEYPESLEELILAEPEDRIDAWGHPFHYRRVQPGESEKGAFVLSCLGADGEPGGEGLDADFSLETDVRERLSERVLEQVGGLIVIDFASQDAAEACSARLVEALPFPAVHTFLEGPRLLVAVGAVDEQGTRARASGEAPSLGDADSFRRTGELLREKGGEASGTRVCRGYRSRSPSALLHELGEWASGEGTLKGASGVFDALTRPTGESGPAMWRMQIAGGRVVTESFALPSASGVRPWMGVRPLGSLERAPVPRDAMAVYACTIDAATLRDVVSAWYAKRTGREPGELEERAAASSGSQPESSFFDALTGEAFAWIMPLGGWTVPKLTVAFGLEREAGVLEALRELAGTIERDLPQTLRVRALEYRGTALLVLDGGIASELSGPWGAIEPTLFVKGGRLYLASSSSQAKREVQRLASDETPDAHPLFARHGPSLRAANRALYMDWAILIETLDETLRFLAGMGAAMVGDLRGLDLSVLPDVSLLTRELRPTVRWSRAFAEGTYTRHEASFGPETWFGVPAAAALLASVAGHGAAGDLEPFVEELDEEHDWTLSVLEELELGLELYARELQSYPLVLAELTEGTENFPRGFLTGRDVPPDGWGQAFRYEREPRGGGYRLWSIGPDGVDQQGEGDDVTAP